MALTLVSLSSAPLFSMADTDGLTNNMSFEQVKQAAAQGDPDAEYALGYMFYYGRGTPRDEDSARLWIGKAAAQGQPQAIKALQLLNQATHPQEGRVVSKTNPLIVKTNAMPVNDTLPNQTPPSATAVSGKNDTRGEVPEVIDASPNGVQAHETTNATPVPEATTTHPSTNYAISHTQTAPTTVTTAAIVNKHEATDPAGAVAQSQPVVAAENHAEIKTFGRAASSSEKKLLATPASYYTIQLLGSHERNDLLEFVQHHHLDSKAIYYKARFNGKPWYVLVYGTYRTQAQAEESLKQLPENVKNANPWVKSMGSVQEGIRQARGLS